MSFDQGFPQFAAPMVDASGVPTQQWQAFFRAVWNRTGGAIGVSSADLQLLEMLSQEGAGGESDAAARSAAQAAYLTALSPIAQPVDYTQPEVFALMLASTGGEGAPLTAENAGVILSNRVMALNFTGGGITASLAAPGLVQVNVPTGAGGVTSVGATSTTSDLTITGSPVTGSGSFGFTVNSAPKWTTARTLTLGADLSGSVSFDGSANFTLNATLANSGVTAGTYGDSTHVAQVTVDAKGRVTSASNVAISASSGGSWFPLTNGVEPPAFISDGAGVPIAVAYTP